MVSRIILDTEGFIALGARRYVYIYTSDCTKKKMGSSFAYTICNFLDLQ